jgi:hypothetical protein
MLPLPTVAARAVARAAKGETSPSSFFLRAQAAELDESGFHGQPEPDKEQDGDHDGPHVAGGGIYPE